MAENTVDYYRAREATGRRLAEEAIDPAIAQIHLDLAERYVALIGEVEASPVARGRLHLKH